MAQTNPPVAEWEAEPKRFDTEALKDVLLELSPLPSVVKYFDDYSGKARSFRPTEESEVWAIDADGTRQLVHWTNFPSESEYFAKCWLNWALATYDVTTVKNYAYYAQRNGWRLNQILSLFKKSPMEVKALWTSFFVPVAKDSTELAWLKSLLRFLCEERVSPWSPEHVPQIAKWSYGSFGRPDRFSSVRNGDAILSLAEERKIVEYFDSINAKHGEIAKSLELDDLRAACLLYWSYQHAFRPIQIASQNLEDTIWINSRSDSVPILQATFFQAKQRKSGKALTIRRSVKREWVWMFSIFIELRREHPDSICTEADRPNSLFGLPPHAVSNAISELSTELTGIRRTPMEFRHSVAQRLVDRGASEVEVAEFLGHSNIDTGLIYFDASPTQADRVNKALGISPIYRTVVEFAKSGSLSTEDLTALPSDHQIGAAPHGIPVAGIGACNLGQSLCTKNPAISCYSCPKFLPLADLSVHQGVRNEFRGLVKEFVEAGRGDQSNPAFMQLRTTLEAIELLINESANEGAGEQ